MRNNCFYHSTSWQMQRGRKHRHLWAQGPSCNQWTTSSAHIETRGNMPSSIPNRKTACQKNQSQSWEPLNQKKLKASQHLSLTLVTLKQLLGQNPKSKFSKILMYFRGSHLVAKCHWTLDRMQRH